MQGNAQVIEHLNRLLTAELTAIDVYFVQSRVLEDEGYTKLFERLNHEMDDERGHATAIIQRILYLEGTPDVASRIPFKVDSDVRAMFVTDLELEKDVAKNLNAAMTVCDEAGDAGSRVILEPLLVDTEMDHMLWLQQQIGMIDNIGIENYLAEQLA